MTNTTNAIDLDALRKDLIEKKAMAEKAAYAYAIACEVGDERIQAFTVYENIRNATRVKQDN